MEQKIINTLIILAVVFVLKYFINVYETYSESFVSRTTFDKYWTNSQGQSQGQGQEQGQGDQIINGCNYTTCQAKISEYTQKGWAYDTSKFGECTGCPSVTYPAILVNPQGTTSDLLPENINECKSLLCQAKIDEYTIKGIPYDINKMAECHNCPIVRYGSSNNAQSGKSTAQVIQITVTYPDNFATVDARPHTFTFIQGKSTPGVLTELNPQSSANALCMLIYIVTGVPVCYFVPASLIVAATQNTQGSNVLTLNLTNTSVNSVSCANSYACGSATLSGVLSQNQLSIIGACPYTLINGSNGVSGNDISPNLVDTHNATVVQTQISL